jgi:hypothetical protein
MGSSNQDIYRGGGLTYVDKLTQRDSFNGVGKDVYNPSFYGVPDDLNKTDRSGVATHLPNELIKIDPSNPACIGYEGVSQNLLLFSEEISGNYSVEQTTVSSNVIAAPNGTISADLILETATNNTHRIRELSNRTILALPYMASIFLKYHSRRYVQLAIGTITDNPSLQFRFINIDILNKTIESADPSLTVSVDINYPNDWFRVSFIMPPPSTSVSNRFVLSLLDDSLNITYAGNSAFGVYCWGLQLAQTPIIIDYVRTSGEIQLVKNYTDGAVVPRLVNLGSIGGSSIAANVLPTLQFPKIYREGSTNRFNLYTGSPFLNFDNNTLNGSNLFTFGDTSTLGFMHRLGFSYSVYIVFSPRQNAINTNARNFIEDIILTTTQNSNSRGVTLVTNHSGIIYVVWTGVTGVAAINEFIRIPNITSLNTLTYPIVFSMLITNVDNSGVCGFAYVNGKKVKQINHTGDVYGVGTTSNWPPYFFRRATTVSSYSGNFRGGLGDIRIFNVRHDEQTHQDIVQMLMKKYKIVG